MNLMPFSQRLHDEFEPFQANNQLYTYNCDEFPMARMSQADFGSPGRFATSLRCIKKSENSGTQPVKHQFAFH